MDPDEKDLNPAGDCANPNPNIIEASGEVPAVDVNENASDKPCKIPVAQSLPSVNPNIPEVLVSTDASMKVFLRIRPVTVSPHKSKSVRPSNDKIAWPKPKIGKGEKVKPEKRKTNCIQVSDCHSVTILPPATLNRMKSEVYRGFTQVFSVESSQEEVYAKTVRPIVEDFLCGKSGLLAALGPSGSGKTHTVFGTARDPGLVPRALRQIFDPSVGTQDKPKRSFYLSMFEIYLDNGKTEKLSDLSPDGGDIQLQQSSLKGLKELLVTDCMQAESLIARGMLRRAIATTNSNSQSSRSQCIINIRCANDNIDGKVETQVSESVLTFVDLAGAEREKKTGNQGDRLLQSNFINKTSMVFGLCLRSLLEHQKSPKQPLRKHFQSSLLTRYLRDYLEGKKRMALILTVRSAEEDYLDTSFLLRQASPYMEITFLNKDEASQSKRHCETSFNAVPEQSKRMKTSCLKDSMDKLKVSARPKDTCQELDEGYPRKVSAKTRKVPVRKMNDELTCKTIDTDSENRRDYKILLGVAKSIWSLLKEHNQKIKMLEKRNLELEKELRDLKSCSCSVEASVEIASLLADTNSETTTNLAKELVGHKIGDSDSEGKKDVSKDVEEADICKTGFDCPEEQRSTYLKFKGDMDIESKPYSYEPVQLPVPHLSAFHESKQNEMLGEVEDCQPTNTKELKRPHICNTESGHPRDECRGSPKLGRNVNNEDPYQGHDLEKEDYKETCCDTNLTDVSKEIKKQSDICKTGFGGPEEQRSATLRCKEDMEMESKSHSIEPVRVSGDLSSDFHEAKENEMVEQLPNCQPTRKKKLLEATHICKIESEHPPDECRGSQYFEGNVNKEESKDTCSSKSLTVRVSGDLSSDFHEAKQNEMVGQVPDCRSTRKKKLSEAALICKIESEHTCSSESLTEDSRELEKAHICKKESEHPQDECLGSQNFEGNVESEESYKGQDQEMGDKRETCSGKKLTDFFWCKEDAKEFEKKAHVGKTELEHPQDGCQGSPNFKGNVKNEDSYQGRGLEKEDNKETCSDKNLTDQTQATVTKTKRGRRGINKDGKQKNYINIDKEDSFSTASKAEKTLIPQGQTSVKTKPKRRMMPASAVFLRHDNCLELQDEEGTVGRRSGRSSAYDTRSTSSSAALLRLLRVDAHR